jgi:hypothetical protein
MLKYGAKQRQLRRVTKIFFVAFVLGGALFIATRGQSSSAAQQPPKELTPAELEFFEKKIRPVLSDNCYACHSTQAKKPQGGLLLDTRAGLLKGGASGQPAVVPGEPEKSLLIKAIRYNDAKLQMPLGGKLPEPVIKDFEQWVRMGAPDPRKDLGKDAGSATAASYVAPYDFNEAKKFWSFQPVKDAQPPSAKNAAWIKNPIDNFILAKLEGKRLKPLGAADKLTLIRRATFDLTGLPPTPDEVEAFLKDTAANAFEKVIDRLLASPTYGEKWGRHWLDLARYADTAGDNSDYPVPAAYRYRNYVINAFNQDKPYDQFIREQLAGDILAKHRPARGNTASSEGEADEPEADSVKKQQANELSKDRQEKIIATGYLAMSRRFGSRNKEMNLTIDDTIDNLGKTFLGLSTSCARCHDHKFDPIPQRDYYALYGIFNSIRYSFPGAEIYKHPAEMIALVDGKEAERFYRQQSELESLDDRHEFLVAEKGTAARNKKEQEQKEKELAQQGKAGEMPATESKSADAKSGDAKRNNESGAQVETKAATQKPIITAVPKVGLRPADFDRDADNWGRAGQSKRLPAENEAELAQVNARILALHAQHLNPPKAYGVQEGLVANARIHRKGDPKNLGEEVPRGFLTIMGGQQVPKDYKGSGRELLADWIADAKNPLTARVMVNRIWLWHFGKGLVQTPNDFGARGKTPTHPELLDWLAARFVAGGWSVKRLHKLIMLSHTYQLASDSSATGQAALVARNAAPVVVDVANDYYWRFNRRRLSAEEVRDAILAVSGQLDRTVGGEHTFPSETTWRFTQHVQFFGVYETNRRSVYVMQQRLKKHPFFEVFDGADTNMPVGERQLSTTPLQALYLMNNPFVHQQADAFAVRVGLAFDALRERLDYAYRLAYGRAPRLAESKEATAYLQQARQDLAAAQMPVEQLNRAALASYLRVVLSSNEFLYVD